jgi:hypothetical protein
MDFTKPPVAGPADGKFTASRPKNSFLDVRLVNEIDAGQKERAKVRPPGNDGLTALIGSRVAVFSAEATQNERGLKCGANHPAFKFL